MNAFLRLAKRNRKDLVLISFLIFFTYNAWYLLPQFTIRSDGFFYMLSDSQRNYWTTRLPITGIQAAGHILGAFLPKIFGVNMPFYYWLELSVVLLIAFLFYLTVRVFTKNYYVAFAASLIASVSYFGVYDMASTHCFCFFFERITIIPFLLISFIFLHLFLTHNKLKHFFLSILFYALGVGLGYFNLLIAPFYLFYIFFYFYFQGRNFGKRLKGLFFMLPFLLLSMLFAAIHMIRDGGISPHQWTFTSFLLQPEKHLYLKKIALQFVYWSQIPMFFGHLPVNPVSDVIDYRIAGSYIPLTLIIYLLAALAIYKLLPKQKPMLLTIVFSLPVIFYLNAYLGQYEMLIFTGSNRYLYLPNFLLAIFWAYFIWAIFWRKKTILIFVGIILLAEYYTINLDLIHNNSLLAIGWAKPTRTIFNYVIYSRPKLSPNTLVVLSYPEFGSQEARFFTEQLGKNKVKYTSENNLVNAHRWEETASLSAHVLKLNFDEKCNCVNEEKIK